jgi:hypothetical protein
MYGITAFAQSTFGGLAENYYVVTINELETLTDAQTVQAAFVGITNELETLTDAQTVQAAFVGITNETQTLTDTNVGSNATSATTNSIVSTNGSAFASASFGEVGFADGYSTIVYSNTLTQNDTESVQISFIGDIEEGQTLISQEDVTAYFLADSSYNDQTLTDSIIGIQGLYASIDEVQTLAIVQTALAAFLASQVETTTLLDYQYARGWFKINDNQTATWGPINDNQTVTWIPINTNGDNIVQWSNNALQNAIWSNDLGYILFWSSTGGHSPTWQLVNDTQ